MLPVVSLDILPADTPAEYAPDMVSACSEALTEGKCVLAAALPESAHPDAVALVLWNGEDYRRVTVRVGRGNGQWVVRSLAFAEADSLPERWVTVGLTVATLVGESPPVRPSPALPNRSPQDAAPAPMEPHSEPERARRFDAGLGVLAGPGWNDGGPQLGAWLSAGVRLPETPFALHLFGSYAQSQGPSVRGSSPSTRWLTAGLSGGASATLRALDLRASAALELAFRAVSAEHDGANTTDHEIPLRVKVHAAYPAESRVAFTTGAIVRVPPLGSEESDGQHLRGPRVAVELLGGVEVRL